MNERILELARVAEQLADDELAHLERVHNRLYSFTEGREIYNKKFAELLIVKCANIIWHEADMKDSAEINEGGYKILEHFGIDWTTK